MEMDYVWHIIFESSSKKNTKISVINRPWLRLPVCARSCYVSRSKRAGCAHRSTENGAIFHKMNVLGSMRKKSLI